MVWENFECYMLQMAIIAFKLSTMVGENFECYMLQMAIFASKLSTMIRENFWMLPFSNDYKCRFFENAKIAHSRTIQEPHPKKHTNSRTT